RIASPRGSTGDVVVSEHDVVETASLAKRRVVLRQLEQKLHWSAENAHARVGDRYQNRQADSRGSRRTPYNEAAICWDAVSASHCRWPRRRAGRCWSECGE